MGGGRSTGPQGRRGEFLWMLSGGHDGRAGHVARSLFQPAVARQLSPHASDNSAGAGIDSARGGMVGSIGGLVMCVELIAGMVWVDGGRGLRPDSDNQR